MAWWQQTGTKRPKRWILVVIALAALASIAAIFWWRGTAAEVATVTSGPIQHSLVFSSRVSSVARTDLAATLTARVEKVLVREGDSVKAGQRLIALDDDDLRAQQVQAQAAIVTADARLKSQFELAGPVASQALAQSRANMEYANADFERTKALHAKGFIGDAKLQDVERAAASARAAFQQATAQATANTRGGAEAQATAARVKEAQAALQIVNAKLEQTSIVAPADARIIARSVEVGDVAQPGKKLLTLAMTGETRLIAQIDEKNLGLVREGMRATGSADAFPDNKFDAELIYLAPSVDVTRGTVESRLRVAKPPAFLRDDMTVSVEVMVAQKQNALTIPGVALREAGDRKYVVVARSGAAQEVDVKLGIRSLQRVEIVSGLSAGDQVVIDERIRAGQRIRAVATVPAPRAK
ncbi:MAG TPA: efflux RND transporter periplasmic adaptor subunit, partial [Casimicrobium sp.]|nr:efflux RND transporter periplasmic adaptor subunit [Casimicrobium sp.]